MPLPAVVHARVWVPPFQCIDIQNINLESTLDILSIASNVQIDGHLFVPSTAHDMSQTQQPYSWPSYWIPPLFLWCPHPEQHYSIQLLMSPSLIVYPNISISSPPLRCNHEDHHFSKHRYPQTKALPPNSWCDHRDNALEYKMIDSRQLNTEIERMKE